MFLFLCIWLPSIKLQKGYFRFFSLNLVLLCHFSEDTFSKQKNKMFYEEQEISDPIYINFEVKVWRYFILLEHIKCIVIVHLTKHVSGRSL